MSTTTIEQTVLEALAGLEPAVTPTATATLEELDIDSLDLAEFAQVVEEELGVRLEVKDLKDVRVVQDVIDVITARRA